MRLATIRTPDGTRAVRVENESHIDLGHRDLGSLLRTPDWQHVAATATGILYDASPEASVDYSPLILDPGKIVCVGLNYRTHILEMGRDLPEAPTLFAKFSDALIGAHDPIALPPESSAGDWEAELVVVIGSTVRRASPKAARRAIAGFTVMNDVTMRDWQFRTKEWLQGKTFEGSTPLGPVLVTPDELDGGIAPQLELSAYVDDEQMQAANTSDLVFGPAALVQYASTIFTLRPGDVIATGTPGGVGHARKPPVYLKPGQTVRTEIVGLGALVNEVRLEVLL